MATATEQAMYTDEQVRRRVFPKPNPGGPVGSIPLADTNVPHHAAVDPKRKDNGARQ